MGDCFQLFFDFIKGRTHFTWHLLLPTDVCFAIFAFVAKPVMPEKHIAIRFDWMEHTYRVKGEDRACIGIIFLA